MTIAVVPLLTGCSGAEFSVVDSTDRDGASDTQIPTNDRNSSDSVGGRGGTGAGGSGGTGAGGSGGTSTGGSGGTGGGGGTDAGDDDGPGDDGIGPSDDAPGDNRFADTSDAQTDSRGDANADRSGDVADAPTTDANAGDAPTTDAKDGANTDARSDASVSDARDSSSDLACTEPVVYYRDQDGDGFGTDNTITTSCVAPGNGWSTMAGDCRDDLSSVKPFQSGWPNPPQYSGTGYADPVKPQGVSFDYDCTGTETGDPSNPFGPVPNCGGLLNCDGAGYLPANPARTGPGINTLCGSTTLQRCNGKLLGNCGLLPPEVTSIPYRCR